jgi:ATP/maltotriose-dependent transcriptional regulator MalT
LSEPELLAAVREAVTHHVLVQGDDETYAFRHALLQETIEADLLPGERASLHLALAEALEADPSLAAEDARVAAELYAHWIGAHRLPEALATAVRAGVEAEHVYAFAEASHHYERAIDLWDQVEDAEDRAGLDEVALHKQAAEGASLSGEGQRALALVRKAIEKTDPDSDRYRAATLRERLARYLWISGDAVAAETVYREAADLLPADEPRAEVACVHGALGQILMLRGRTSESVERCEQAIAIAREVGAKAEEGHALNTLGVNAVNVGDRETGMARLREALRMAEEWGEADDLARAYVNLSDTLDQDGQIEASVELALEGARRARELGLRDYQLFLEGEAARRLATLGRLDEAYALTDGALEAAPSMSKLVLCASRAAVEVLRGRAVEAEPLLDAADAGGRRAQDSMWLGHSGSLRAELEIGRGREEEARRVAEQALELAADHEFVFYTARLYAMAARAEARLAERARAQGDKSGAADAEQRARGLNERIHGLLETDAWVGSPPSEAVIYGEVCAAEAERAAGNADAAAWAGVAERWGEHGAVLEEAYARLRQAECLALAGERTEAAEVVGPALDVARRAGARPLQEELESLMRRARLEPAAADGDGAAPRDAIERLGLTERELAVLELVAQGMTNRQIGEELFISDKTASVHVSRILSKLDVGSRVEAATAAQRLGIVS